MTGIITFILICYGATSIIVNGKIFENVRGKSYMLNCQMCMGFWVGLLVAYLDYNTHLFTFDNNIVTLVMLGALSSGTSYILDRLFNDDGIQLSLGVKGEGNSE